MKIPIVALMDSSLHPNIHVRRCEHLPGCLAITVPRLISTDILEAAGRDPRYILLLPVLFVPEEVPAPSIAETLDDLFAAEAQYPADLRHCEFNHNTGAPPLIVL